MKTYVYFLLLTVTKEISFLLPMAKFLAFFTQFTTEAVQAKQLGS